MRIQCNGEIVASEDRWLYNFYGVPCFCPADLREAITQLKPDEELVLEINSGGGSVFAGFETYSVLRRCRNRTVAEVQSLAASAASTILQGCDVRRLSPVGQVMIHNPSCGVVGNREDLRQADQMLEAGKESILNAYELRCRDKCSREKLSELMDKETWLTAQDAIALGLADEVLEESAAVNHAAAMRNAVGGVSREELMERFRQEHQLRDGENGEATTPALRATYPDKERQGMEDAEHPMEASPIEAEAQEHDPTAPGAEKEADWTQRARLAIEKMRYMEVSK